jgi:hypothetical protein
MVYFGIKLNFVVKINSIHLIKVIDFNFKALHFMLEFMKSFKFKLINFNFSIKVMHFNTIKIINKIIVIINYC